MTSTDADRYTYPDGSLHLYRYRLTSQEHNVLNWVARHGGAHEPLPAAFAVIAGETLATPDETMAAYQGLAERGLALPLDPDAPALQLAPVDAVTNLCGCPHTDPTVWPPYGVGNGAATLPSSP